MSSGGIGLDNFFHYLSTHPIAAIIVAVIILFMVYFVIKKLLKVALIFGLILIAVSGYFYYTAPEEFPDNMKSTIGDVKDQTEKLTDKGKNMIDKGKKLAEGVEKAIKDKR
jgi:c-di-AMP phosphodiesterase-like protein